MSQSPEMQLQKNELTAYLREIFRLEYKKQSMEQTYTELQKKLGELRDRPYPPKPGKKGGSLPKTPEKKKKLKKDKPINGLRVAAGVVAFFITYIGGCYLLLGATANTSEYTSEQTRLAYVAMIAGVIVGIIAGILTHKLLLNLQWKQDLTEYEEKLAQYRAQEASAEANYAAAMERYRKDCERIDAENANLRNARKHCGDVMDPMAHAIVATGDALKQLYSYDIIHPQYRSFMAIAHLLSYFESGRVDTLKEALNKYDTDLFQGRLLQSLDAISFSQDLTRMAIEENNNLLAGVRTNMNTMIAQGEASQAQQHLAAQNSQAILSSVQNMEFRQTIDMLDRYSRR